MPGKCTARERFALDILKKHRQILDNIDCSRPGYWYNVDTKYMNNLDSIAAAFVDVLSVLCHTVITPSTIASDSV